MPPRHPPRLTDVELEILNVLWRLGPATVKQVNLGVGFATGYTTTLKMLQIMTDKGLVLRDESARAHLYRPAKSREATQQQLVSRLLAGAFQGSAAQLVLQALAAHRATPAELAEIEQMVQQLRAEAP